MVREFHEAFKLHIANKLGFNDLLPLRHALLAEEYGEYLEASENLDIIEFADALADMVYVIYGTALTFGIDLDSVLEEVHASNMSKLDAFGNPILRADGKVLKGPRFFKPDIKSVLENGN
jgi:predicted HAD superfamily Cof-like phosphohydrolase